MTSICCVCNKIKLDGEWSTAEVFDDQEQISHGYCPVCYDKVLEDIRMFFQENTDGSVPNIYDVPIPDVAELCA